MAQLKDLLVTGPSSLIGDVTTNKILITTLNAPTSSGGTTYGAGTSGYVLKTNGTSVYWGTDSNSVTGVKGDSESSYRTGNVNITKTNIGLGNVANYDQSKAIKSITRSGTTFTYTCLDGTTGSFTLQDNNTTSFTITANATDGLWDLTGTNGTNSVTYSVAPYSGKSTTATFYTAASNPTLNTRLNYDGYFYATKLYSGGNEVLTSHLSLSGYLPLSGGTMTGYITLHAAPTNNMHAATKKYVDDSISGLSGPMKFIGTLGTGGTTTTLAAAATANLGYTYKVITAGTYLNKLVKDGDMLVSTGSEWVIIPSGDEPSGTVTNIATGSGLTGGPITTSGTISHAVPLGATASTLGNSTTRYYIKTITTDDFGHVTGVTTGNESVTNTHYNTHLYAGNLTAATSHATTGTNGNVYLRLYDDTTAREAIKIVGSGATTVTDGGGTITIASTNTTYNAATSTTAGLMSAADKAKLDGIATTANNYSLPVATSAALGGVRIGYTQSDKNYPVLLNSNNQMYVNVPWSNTTYSFSAGTSTLAWATTVTLATVGGVVIKATLPANPNTDTKVTSEANHYTPSAASSALITASLTGTAGSYALNTEYTVITGINVYRDTKGHVTDVKYTALKIKDTNTHLTHTTTTATFVKTVSLSGGAVPTLGTELSADNITAWSAGSAPSLTITSTACDDITAWTTNTPTSATVNNGILTITAGSAASLSYTARTIGSASGWSAGSVPSLSYDTVTIPNVTSVGSMPTVTTTTGTAVTGIS